jgi:fermentation-respiration switch protein FrsA (DUF1100 family)
VSDATPVNNPASAGDKMPTAVARPRWRRNLARLALFVGTIYLAIVILMSMQLDSLIFFPSRYPEGDWQPRGLRFEDAHFAASDGTRLHGWYLPADNPRAVVLFAHGNGGNLSDRADIGYLLSQRLGASVLMFDYRGYGRSEGEPTIPGVLDDARAARRWLAERAGVSESQIVLMGESLGGGVMIQLAAHDGARALILENTFSSLADVGAVHYPWLPVRFVLGDKLDSTAVIAKYRGPLLQIHGDADQIIPMTLGRKLFEAANEPKRWVTISGADHNDPRTKQAAQALDEFLGSLPSDAR